MVEVSMVLLLAGGLAYVAVLITISRMTWRLVVKIHRSFGYEKLSNDTEPPLPNLVDA